MTDPPTLRQATIKFLEEDGEHNTEEDMHPPELDPVQAELHAALSRRSQARAEEGQDAGDA